MLLMLSACGSPSGTDDGAGTDELSGTGAAGAGTAAGARESAGVDASESARAEEESEIAAELSATERALAQLTAAYGELAERFGDESGRAIDWAESDIENLGDWEYRVVVLSDAAPEEIEEALNALGQERWEAYWIEPSRNGLRVFLKRPSISYLSRVPLSAVVRMLTGGQ